MTDPNRTVLVTGGAGYIGSHACKALARAGYRPVVYDNLSTGNEWAVKWGPLERGDVRDPERVAEVIRLHRPVAAMHFAALALVGESMREPAWYYATNVLGTMTLADACCAAGIGALVFSSTCAIYGVPSRIPIREDEPKAPINPYGAAKLMAERLLEDYDRAYGLRHAALRYFNAAGADPEAEIGECRREETHLVPLAIDAALGRRPRLTLFGTDYPTPDGTAVRDYVHVGDLAQAHIRALDRLLAGSASFQVNLGTGRGYSVREVIDAVAVEAGTEVPHDLAGRRAGDPPYLVADPAAAAEILGKGIFPASSLASIIRTAVRWHRASPDPVSPREGG